MSNNGKKPFSEFLLQTIKALLIASFAFLFILAIYLSIVHMIYAGRIFPGVYVDEFHVGGMSAEEAAVALTQNYSPTNEATVQLNYLQMDYPVQPSEIGLTMDPIRSALSALNFGRSGQLNKRLYHQVFLFSRKIEVAPVFVFNENQALAKLQTIAQSEDKPVIEAKLTLDGIQVIALPGQIGHTLDIDASIEKIGSLISRNNFDQITLVVSETAPALLDTTPFIADAQAILEQPFIITTPEDSNTMTNRWTITPDNLAPMLTFSTTENFPQTIKPQFKDESMHGLLTSIAEQVDSPPENPRFIFNDDTLKLDLDFDGIPGIRIDLEKSKLAIQSALIDGNNSAELAVDTLEPEVSNSATGEELGITELVYAESSYFYGSDTARIQNIETAANEFLGVLIKPGETFSMANTMRDISLDNGYSEALIIYNGKTIEGVGGGVCQVSTTLFRTAFFAGFPIVERHPHAYRVSYYEKVAGNYRDTNLAGLDATVYIPLVDLKFTNDTPYWLLMEAYVNRSASRITWKFYSTYDGRSMEWQTTGLTNKIEPKKPLYELNEDLDTGEIEQVDWEAEGADVTVNRVVYKEGDILFEDSFFTRYAPWRAVYEYGPGTDGIPN